jgi:flagellar biosynthesis protein FlhF
MRIKSFYASSVEGAVGLARREMGDDAMLVESRRAPLEARHLGEYEVVCAVVPEAKASPTPEPVAAQDPRLAVELAEMRRQLDVMGRTITRSAWGANRWSSAAPELSRWYAGLLAADLDADLASQILEAVERSGPPDGPVAALFAREVEKCIRVDSFLDSPGGAPRVTALVGPPGAGKTSMIAKLAVAGGVAARRSLALFSMDDYRVAGADQLRSYATILGAAFQSFDQVGALAQALEEGRGRHWILIDTPGYGPRDMDRAADLAQFLSTHPAIDTHLVLTASMKSADLKHVAERFELFHPSSLIFTRVDETGSFGTALSLSAALGKPISYLAAGQEIPDDLESATKARILDLLGVEKSRAESLAA